MINRPLAAAVLGLCALGAAACGGPAASDAASAAPAASPKDQASKDRPSAVSAASAGEAAAAKPLAGKVVVIDPGHNGGNWRHPREINKQVNILTQKKACDTTGTSTNDGYTEAQFTLDVSRRLADLLRRQGATVKLTRTDNRGWGPCITDRAAAGNRAGADAAISIHADGAPPSGHGFHVIMPKKIGGPVDAVVSDSARLGRAVRDAVHRDAGLPYSNYLGRNALDFRGDLGGLNLSKVPKIFIECGNMRNPGDAAKLKNAAFRQRLAKALANGLRDYLT